MNIAEWLAATAHRRPDAPALLEGDRVRSDYRGFAATAAAIADRLVRRYGVRPGDRVGLYLANQPRYLELLYGIWWCGAIAVPINRKLTPAEVAVIVADAEPAVLFTDDVTGDATRDAKEDATGETAGIQDSTREVHALADAAIPVVPASEACPPMPPGPTAASSGPAGPSGSAASSGPAGSLGPAASSGPAAALDSAAPIGPDGPGPVEREPDDVAWLFYTSGTTGRPKGVMLTHANLIAMSLCYLADVDAVGAGEAVLYAAPISHGAGLYGLVHVRAGSRHVFPPSGRFDADEVLDLARAVGEVSLFAAPTMVRRLVRAARRRGEHGEGLKTVVYGGGPMYLADIREAIEVMGPRFVQIYGQGESPMTITALSREDHRDTAHPRYLDRLAGVGTAQSVVRVRIRGRDGNPLPPGREGEVEVKGATVMAGYWRDPEATAAAIDDGWLRTGDLGRLDEDGYLTLVGRIKDVIISGGSNIYPREVEDALVTHPSVAEAAVVGLPDPEWGEIAVAFVVPAEGAVLAEADLDEHCLRLIARFKRPRRYHIVPDLPKNAYGKVLKTELRAAAAARRPREETMPESVPEIVPGNTPDGRTGQIYEDIRYEEKDHVATITFNRPDRLNAFRGRTYGEVADAVLRAGYNPDIGVIVLTGAGERAFAVGGDKAESKADRVGQGRGTLGVPVEEMQTAIRDVPKPVIAKVRGYAIGSGNVIVTLCDLAIASENAVFGQAGPKMGSVDPGFGTALLARIVGEKKAREFWFLCRRYTAHEALAMGLVNQVVPDDRLDEEVDRWCREINELSPTALAIAKRSFNADSEHIRGSGLLAFQALALYFGTDESKEGGEALRAKRKPDFRKAMRT